MREHSAPRTVLTSKKPSGRVVTCPVNPVREPAATGAGRNAPASASAAPDGRGKCAPPGLAVTDGATDIGLIRLPRGVRAGPRPPKPAEAPLRTGAVCCACAPSPLQPAVLPV
ncbi:hypothetical protein GCM10018785_30200 [Streptomyces longispororuber]|uniref:Uncharacterized protein n=1 Tax=Streptomyces longispororuber TaxID=68230 RepID=A0A918ZNB9_9ACTN|nr:hypothetical protein GCM10018785_30200 [Streptomyces longispororuber]